MQTNGRKVAARFVTLLALPNTYGHDRLGIIASRKLGNAVVRNRAKRRLRELFRHRRASESSTPLDIVAIPRRDGHDAPFAALASDFDAALGRLRGRR